MKWITLFAISATEQFLLYDLLSLSTYYIIYTCCNCTYLYWQINEYMYMYSSIFKCNLTQHIYSCIQYQAFTNFVWFILGTVVYFNQSHYYATESEGQVYLVLRLSNPISTDITVQLESNDSSAKGK